MREVVRLQLWELGAVELVITYTILGGIRLHVLFSFSQSPLLVIQRIFQKSMGYRRGKMNYRRSEMNYECKKILG